MTREQENILKKYGFIEEKENPLRNYNNGYRYVVDNRNKQTTSNTSASNLFKSSGRSLERECNFVNRKVMLNSTEENKLEMSRQLTKLFEDNRYAMSVSKDNAKSVYIKLMYGKKGAYFTTIDSEDIHINYDIDSIEKLDYVPSGAMQYGMSGYSTYELFKKHSSGSMVSLGKVVFAN